MMAAYASALRRKEFLTLTLKMEENIYTKSMIMAAYASALKLREYLNKKEKMGRERERERERDELDDDGSVCVIIKAKRIPHNKTENGEKNIDTLRQRMRRYCG